MMDIVFKSADNPIGKIVPIRKPNYYEHNSWFLHTQLVNETGGENGLMLKKPAN